MHTSGGCCTSDEWHLKSFVVQYYWAQHTHIHNMSSQAPADTGSGRAECNGLGSNTLTRCGLDCQGWEQALSLPPLAGPTNAHGTSTAQHGTAGLTAPQGDCGPASQPLTMTSTGSAGLPRGGDQLPSHPAAAGAALRVSLGASRAALPAATLRPPPSCVPVGPEQQP